jgi:hypothetical protein
MGSGIAMFAAFWLLLVTIVRAVWRSQSLLRLFVLAGCAALAVGTLQGPVQAVPLVNEALDRGGEAGDVIVNLHAQLNMLGGLMLLLAGLSLVALHALGAEWQERRARLTVRLVAIGMAVYYAAGVTFSAIAGAPRRRRRVVRLRGLRARAVAVARARPGRAARSRRVCRVRIRRLAHERAPARGGPCRGRRHPSGLLGHDPETRQAPEPGSAGGATSYRSG